MLDLNYHLPLCTELMNRYYSYYWFIIMLNWPSYQQSKTWDYQRLDCVEGGEFLVDIRLFPAQRKKER